jgi:hypothetical protein
MRPLTGRPTAQSKMRRRRVEVTVPANGIALLQRKMRRRRFPFRVFGYALC